MGAAVMSLPSAVVAAAAAAAVAGPDGNGSAGSGRRHHGEEDCDDAPTPDGHDGCVHNIARHCPPHEHPVANTTSSARIFEDADFWIYKQPIVLYNLLDARYVSHTGGGRGACPMVAGRRSSFSPHRGAHGGAVGHPLHGATGRMKVQ